MEKIANGTFEINGRVIKLVDGVFRAPDNSLSVFLSRSSIIYGELTNNGDKGCVVQLGYKTGGMGTFYNVVVLREINGDYQQVFSVVAGSNYSETTFELTEDKYVRIVIKYREAPEQVIHCSLSQLFK